MVCGTIAEGRKVAFTIHFQVDGRPPLELFDIAASSEVDDAGLEQEQRTEILDTPFI